MPQNLESPIRIRYEEDARHGARIKVVGVGGGGSNAVNRMIDSGLDGVEFISMNTDLQSLRSSKAQVQLQLGKRITRGLGTGASPETGRRAALEDSEKIIEALEGADMVFITAGLGGGTGTGAAPVIASLASQMGALTVAIVTRPFGFEGKRRKNQAERGVQELLDHADTLIVIPNDKLLSAAINAGFFESFQIADEVLRQAVQGISDIVTASGVINRDFADVRTTLAGMGYAVMGTATRRGPNRAVEAAIAAITSPMLEAGAIDGARGILINITGSNSLKLSEVSEASMIIENAAHEDANIIFGAILDERLDSEIKVTVIASGFREDSLHRAEDRLNLLSRIAQPIPHFEETPTYKSISPNTTDFIEECIPEPTDDEAAEQYCDGLSAAEIGGPPEQAVSHFSGDTVTQDTSDESTEDQASSAVPQLAEEEEQKPSEEMTLQGSAYSFEDDLLTSIDGPEFDFSESPAAVEPDSLAESSTQPEIRKLRQTAMAAYRAIDDTEIEDEAEPSLKTPSFAEILAEREKVLGSEQRDVQGKEPSLQLLLRDSLSNRLDESREEPVDSDAEVHEKYADSLHLNPSSIKGDELDIPEFLRRGI